MSPDHPRSPYRIEDLAHHSGATVRTIRAYQDRGLLPKPERRGRANVYDDSHLARLHQISALLERGFTLASIKELLTAWDSGLGLGGVLGLVTEVDGPWSDESPDVVTRADLATRFGARGRAGARSTGAREEPGPASDEEREGNDEELDEEALAEAVELGVLVPVSGKTGVYHVPSPQELAVATELHSAGVPLRAVTGHLRELRGQIEHIAGRFLDFTTEHVFAGYLDHPPTDQEIAEATSLVRRLRPLAQQTVDAELARAMGRLATRHLHHHMAALSLPLPDTSGGQETRLGHHPAEGVRRGERARTGAGTGDAPTASDSETDSPCPRMRSQGATDQGATGQGATGQGATGQGAAHREVADDMVAVALPASTVAAVRQLVGEGEAGTADKLAAFVAAATEREVQARTLDRLSQPEQGSARRPEQGPARGKRPGPEQDCP